MKGKGGNEGQLHSEEMRLRSGQEQHSEYHWVSLLLGGRFFLFFYLS